MINILASNTPGMELIRNIFAIIDKGIYSLIPLIYDLLLQLAKMTIFSNEDINNFAGRIYTFLGIIMLFKVTFSLIQYLVNPDSLSDKTIGAGNLAKNMIITLFLIIIVPFGFDLLYNAQSAILEDNLIPKLILGTEEDSVDGLKLMIDIEQCVREENGEQYKTYSYPESSGEYMALVTFRPFYQIQDGVSFDNNTSRTTYCSANSVSKLLQSDILAADNDDKYVIEYSILISTAVGVLVLLLLLEFCFDVAMRCIKLAFLEITAPIAIITYIDPKSSKNGAFTKWLKEVLGTWARLFIRLAILFFVVYFIDVINRNLDMYMENGLWIMLFLVIGALLFAKKAVSLIEDIFGFKFDHSIQLNPFKKIQDQALGGKQILGAGAGLVGAAGGAIAGGRAGFQVGATGRGALLGAISGFNNGKSDLKNPFGTGMNKTYKELTGNDMVNLTPAKFIMGMSSKGSESVNQVGDHLKVARERLNQAHTDLNKQSHISVENSTALTRLQEAGYAVDMKNLAGSRQTAIDNITALTRAKEVNEIMYGQAKTQYEIANSEYEQSKKFMDDYKNKSSAEKLRNLEEYNKKKQIVEKFESGHLERLKNNMLNSQQELNKVEKDLSSNKTIVTAIDRYQQSENRETEIRGEISKIEKEISTLSDEKKQRERFWQVDTSPKESLEKAMANNPVQKKDK